MPDRRDPEPPVGRAHHPAEGEAGQAAAPAHGHHFQVDRAMRGRRRPQQRAGLSRGQPEPAVRAGHRGGDDLLPGRPPPGRQGRGGPGEQLEVSANTLHVALAIPEDEAERLVEAGRAS
jgi:hypothetical protein